MRAPTPPHTVEVAAGRDVSGVGPVSPPAPTGVAAGDGAVEDTGDGRALVIFREGMTMQDLEREAIVAVLKGVHGNRRKAAEQLGIGERTLYRKIKEYGLPL